MCNNCGKDFDLLQETNKFVKPKGIDDIVGSPLKNSRASALYAIQTYNQSFDTSAYNE